MASKRNRLLLSAVAAGVMAGAGLIYAAPTSTQDPMVIAQAEGEAAKDIHACAGLNSCKGKGGCKTDANECAGKNECKGKGGCASAEAKHECKGKNNCKALGGCKVEGANECAGKNECKGKGGCKVPMEHDEEEEGDEAGASPAPEAGKE